MATVIIVGGGFAGLAIGLCLQQRGIQSTIFETRDESFTSGGNIALAPNALRVLDHIGVYENIRQQGYNYEELSFANGTGSTLGVFLNGSQKIYNYQALRIHRTAVRDALRRKCAQNGVPMVYGKKCVDIKEEDQRVTVTFHDGTRVTSDFLIGADGIHSMVRGSIMPGVEQPHFSGLMGVMGSVMEADLEEISHSFNLPAMLFGKSGSFAIMPANYEGDEMGYFATIEANDRSRGEWNVLGEDKDQLKKMLTDRFAFKGSPWPDLVQAVCNKTSLDDLTCWPYVKSLLLTD